MLITLDVRRSSHHWICQQTDVLCMGILMKEKKLLEDDVAMQNYPNKVFATDLAVHIIKQWYRANPKFQPPVTISKRALVMRIEKLWERLSSIVR